MTLFYVHVAYKAFCWNVCISLSARGKVKAFSYIYVYCNVKHYQNNSEKINTAKPEESITFGLALKII